jgi:hypothetical protein
MRYVVLISIVVVCMIFSWDVAYKVVYVKKFTTFFQCLSISNMLLIISEWVSFSHVLWQKLACCTDNAFYCTSANSVNMKKDVNRTCYINPAKLYILAQLEYDCTYLHTNRIEYIAYDVDLILNIYL